MIYKLYIISYLIHNDRIYLSKYISFNNQVLLQFLFIFDTIKLLEYRTNKFSINKKIIFQGKFNK